MRFVVLASLLVGCSIDRGGLGDGPTSLIDAATPADTSVFDASMLTDGNADTNVDTTTEDVSIDTAPSIDASLDATDTKVNVDAGSDILTKPEADAIVVKDTGCALKAGDPCAKIAKLATTQTLDGDDTEFCGVPYVDVNGTNGEYLKPDPPSEWSSGTIRARVAWSALGLHMHFTVKDALFAPAPVGKDPFEGDEVEVFVAGHDKLTGAFDGKMKDKGATQILLGRPQTDGTSRASIWYGAYGSEYPKENYKSVARAYGYDVELFVPWKLIEGVSIASGTKIGFDFAFNDRRDLSTADDQYMGYRVRKPIPAGYCGGFYCDDRVWCQPSLE